MSSQHYETIERGDRRRACVSPSGTLMLTRWCDQALPDGFYFTINGAPLEKMQAVADAINAAIDAADGVARIDLRRAG